MKKTTKLEQIKQLGRLIGYIFVQLWKAIRNKYVWVAVFFIVWTYCIAWFNSNYEIKAVWKFGIYPRSTPIKNARIVTKVEAQEIKPTPTPDPLVALKEEAFDTVWFNESNRGNDKSGLNGDCIKKGLLNEIGYAPHQGYCFTDRQEQKETFMLWLNNRLNHVKMPYCNNVNECILFYTNNSYGL